MVDVLDLRPRGGRQGAPKTITGYLTDAKWVSRTIGGVRLCGLTPEHIDSLYGAVRRADRSPGTVLHVRRTVRAALQTAVDRGRINRNPVSLAEAPGDDAPEVEPLDGSDVQAVLTAPAGVRSGARWVLALVTGMRQGEIRGHQWEDIFWDTGEVRRALGRRAWRHGCCAKNARSAPRLCPRRVGGGPVAGPLKTKTARRLQESELGRPGIWLRMDLEKPPSTQMSCPVT